MDNVITGFQDDFALVMLSQQIRPAKMLEAIYGLQHKLAHIAQDSAMADVFLIGVNPSQQDQHERGLRGPVLDQALRNFA